MNQYLASLLMRHMDDGRLACDHAPDEVIEWFDTLGLPIDLLRFMQWNWPQKFCEIGPLSILPSVDIPKQAAIDVFLAQKLLPVGCADDGCLFVIDFSVESCPVGFVSSMLYYADGAFREYGDDSPQELREYFQPAARSVESFLFHVSEGRFFPCDYGAAAEFNDFLKEEAAHHAFPPFAPIALGH